MATQLVSLLGFNRGRVSARGLARVDIDRVPLSADVMTNWMPRVLGSMSLRPGWNYLGATLNSNKAKFLPFIFSTTDTALLELTDSNMRVWIGDALLTRAAVTAAVANGNFTVDLSSWTQNDEAGGVSTWLTGSLMGLTGNGTAAAIRDQQVFVNQQNVEHALRIVINNGPVIVSIGQTLGGGEYYNSITLETGTQSLAFTPTTGSFFIRFLSRLKRQVMVKSVNVEAAGVVSIPTPWPVSSLDLVRWDQSADIIFTAVEGYQQQRIERHGARSWGIARYAPEDGPFFLQNVTATTITSSALSGNGMLTASRPIFASTHVGALFSLSSTGQDVTANIVAQNTFTSPIKVTNVGTNRSFTVNRTNTGSGILTLQSSTISSTGPWTDVKQYAANTTENFNDGTDNLIVWYRIGCKTGDYTSGTIGAELNYAIGTQRGIARVTAYTSPTVVSAEIITDFGGITPTTTWEEGQWSNFRGFPSAISFHDGRIWWAGKGGLWGSVSDAFSSFDETFLGDAGPLNETIGQGPVDRFNWILSLHRLLLGTPGAELAGISTSFDEPLTPSNFHIKVQSGQGSGTVQAVKVDTSGIYVQRGGTRVFELSLSGEKYESIDLTAYIPEIGKPSIIRMAAQRQPDTRIHCVRSDGTVAVLIFDAVENVLAWIDVTTLGNVEDVVVLPGLTGNDEDQVYYIVNRTVNGATVRYLEKWALESECIGGTTNKQADAFALYSGQPATVIGGLGHLIGQSVVCWADGIDQGGPYTVSAGGQITLPVAVSNAVIGLGYTAQWKSSKLSHRPFHFSTFTGRGTALTQKKHLEHLGLILYKSHTQGLQFGPDFTHLDSLPQIESGTVVTSTIYDAYDQEAFEFPGTWDTDARLCLQAAAPRPCTVMACIMPIDIEDKP